MSMKRNILAVAVAAATLAGIQPASSAEALKIGISAGLTGYAATVDRAWRDGVQVAADALNAKGGVMGRKIEVVVEDNRSEPQEAVTVYRKMMTSDNVDVFISGCVSAGNFAAASMVAKAEKPMMLCSILPQQAAQVKWAFTTLPPAGFEVEKRFEYLRDKTDIRKVGVLHDPTPYALLQKTVAQDVAAKYGLQVVGVESYKQDDADLSVQISKIQAAGAGAIIKIGLGGTTLTAAKNLKQLNSSMLMLTSLEDLAVFKPVAEVLGDKFFFVASPSQVYDALPDSPTKAEIGKFLEPWRAKFGDRDPNWASRGWDGVMLTVAAITNGKSAEGPAIRDNIEKITGFQGTTGVYNFTAANHQGITQNPFVLATISGGQVKIVQ
ncbi:ABC transporter substrate-binding protein [Azospirillum canadense]|uniref:ABC transporter substrate-binding protein n=1 Tax=Azospirillum canadense TaxID=403962 RepID=UPI0022263F17|nr:ABC transporter substrate-binding protein [Azospirillum canadense]MCW2238787.1 branched-chain amino acid transport system substrate-binding protein [Azospirillum canadense]